VFCVFFFFQKKELCFVFWKVCYLLTCYQKSEFLWLKREKTFQTHYQTSPCTICITRSKKLQCCSGLFTLLFIPCDSFVKLSEPTGPGLALALDLSLNWTGSKIKLAIDVCSNSCVWALDNLRPDNPPELLPYGWDQL
jgi:hypothetical protein